MLFRLSPHGLNLLLGDAPAAGDGTVPPTVTSPAAPDDPSFKTGPNHRPLIEAMMNSAATVLNSFGTACEHVAASKHTGVSWKLPFKWKPDGYDPPGSITPTHHPAAGASSPFKASHVVKAPPDGTLASLLAALLGSVAVASSLPTAWWMSGGHDPEPSTVASSVLKASHHGETLAPLRAFVLGTLALVALLFTRVWEPLGNYRASPYTVYTEEDAPSPSKASHRRDGALASMVAAMFSTIVCVPFTLAKGLYAFVICNMFASSWAGIVRVSHLLSVLL